MSDTHTATRTWKAAPMPNIVDAVTSLFRCSATMPTAIRTVASVTRRLSGFLNTSASSGWSQYWPSSTVTMSTALTPASQASRVAPSSSSLGGRGCQPLVVAVPEKGVGPGAAGVFMWRQASYRYRA